MFINTFGWRRAMRHVMLAMLWVMAWGSGSAAHAQEDKVVYHVNDWAHATAALRNINNHLEVNPRAKIVVVTHAQGVDFLMDGKKDNNGNPYNIPVEGLKARGVKFDVCEITL